LRDLAHDRPDLLLRRLDDALHAARPVDAEDDIDSGFRLFTGVRGCHGARECQGGQQALHGDLLYSSTRYQAFRCWNVTLFPRARIGAVSGFSRTNWKY